MKPSEYIYKEALRLRKVKHPLDDKPAPQDLLYAVMKYLDDSMELAQKLHTLTKDGIKKKGKD